MQIRTLQPYEAALHRAVRLRALRDAPASFGETLAEAEALSSQAWEERTRIITQRHVLFLACVGEAAWGCAYGILTREHPEKARVGGMWVDPARRRQGVGRALLDAVLGWAQAKGLRRVGLWAPPHAEGTLALYRGAGFRENGNRGALQSDHLLSIVELEREL